MHIEKYIIGSLGIFWNLYMEHVNIYAIFSQLSCISVSNIVQYVYYHYDKHHLVMCCSLKHCWFIPMFAYHHVSSSVERILGQWAGKLESTINFTARHWTPGYLKYFFQAIQIVIVRYTQSLSRGRL